MAVTTAERKVKEKNIATAFSWPASVHQKIQAHQYQMALTLKRKVNFDEAITHFVERAIPPAI